MKSDDVAEGIEDNDGRCIEASDDLWVDEIEWCRKSKSTVGVSKEMSGFPVTGS